MSTQLVINRLGLIALSLIAAGQVIAAAKDASTTLQINKFRFQKHGKQSFERLVLEFTKKEHGKPAVKVSIDAKTHEATITLAGAQLVGAIPEASINDAYGSKSTYLGHLTVNSDNPNALAFKTTLRDKDTMVDALWLENPARLVLDAFPKGSPRAAGPQVLDGRGVASHEKSEHGEKVAKAAPVSRGGNKTGFTCFPANAQLNGAVDNENDEEMMKIRIDSAVIPTSQETAAGISCYPRKAELKAQIVYAPGKAEKKAADVTMVPAEMKAVQKAMEMANEAPAKVEKKTEEKKAEVAAKKINLDDDKDEDDAKPAAKKAEKEIASEKPVMKAPAPLLKDEKPVVKAPEKLAPKPLLGNSELAPKKEEKKSGLPSLEKSASLEDSDSKTIKQPSLEKKSIGSLLPAVNAETPKAAPAAFGKNAAKKINLDEEDGAESDLGGRVPAAKEPKAANAKPTGAGSLLPPLK